EKRHRSDLELGAAVERAGAGEASLAQAHDAPVGLDRLLASVADYGADAAPQDVAFADLDRRPGRGFVDDHADHSPPGLVADQRGHQSVRVGRSTGAGIVLHVGEYDRLAGFAREFDGTERG